MNLVVTLPATEWKNPRLFALRARRNGATILEIRGDLTPFTKPFRSPLPLIIAPRGAGVDFLRKFPSPTYVDLDLSEHELISSVPPRTHCIFSFHDFDKTPALPSKMKIVQKMYTKKSWMIKIVTKINAESDLVRLRKLQQILNKKCIQTTVLGMGPKGHFLRVMSPYWNRLTYACLSMQEASADGQLTVSLYELLRGRSNPAMYGIIGGSQIASSMSPILHNALFRRHRIDAVYTAFPTDHFSRTLLALKPFNVRGYSVTAPFKEDAARIAKKKDPSVQSLRVANTLTQTATGWSASNTDIDGICEGYPRLCTARSIAILGAGSVVRSLLYVLRSINPQASVFVYARDLKKARRFLSGFQVSVEPLSSADRQSVDAVICAVTADVSLPIPRTVRSGKGSIAIDLRYGYRTRFLSDAKKRGFRIRDGRAMLLVQGMRQYELFTGKKPSFRDRAYLKKILDTAMLSS